jgi:large subunit ribosomal protein L10
LNRDQKSAVIDEVAGELKEAQAVFAVDYRGISVQQVADLRTQLYEAGARFRVVKNRLTQRAADDAGMTELKDWLEGPTALTFVSGDAALAAKAIATVRREHDVLEFKGGTMDGQTLSIDELNEIARLPALEVLRGQFVGVLASPITGLVRGLASLISGLAIQLEQIRAQGLVSGEAPAAEAREAPVTDAPAEEEAPPAEEEAGSPPAEEPGGGGEEAPVTESHEQQEGEVVETTAEPAAENESAEPAADAPGDPVAEAETAGAEGEEPSDDSSDS